MAFLALYDACVLYPAPVRDLLLEVAHADLVGARWTSKIEEEWVSNLLKQRNDIPPPVLERTVELMRQAVPDALVRHYEPFIPSLELPDPDDRHVLAAAIKCGAQVIVTFNIKDFPRQELDKYDIEAERP